MTNIGHDDRSSETRRGESVGAADIACFLSARRSAAPAARAPRPIVGDKHPACASVNGAQRPGADRCPASRPSVAADGAAREPETVRGSRPCAETPSEIPGGRRSPSSSFSLPAAPTKRSRHRVEVTTPVRLVMRSIKTSGDARLDDRRIRKFDAPLAFGMSQRLCRALWGGPGLPGISKQSEFDRSPRPSGECAVRA
jgi:hypothetical protein